MLGRLPVFLLASLISVSAGCADETALLISVDGSALSVPDDIDALLFQIEGINSGRMATFQASVTGEWPQTLAVRPGDAGNDEEVRIHVQGLRGNAIRVQRVVSGTFRDGRSVPVAVLLEASCVDVNCGQNVDCRGGVCGGNPPTDAGVDGGADAGADVPVIPMDGGMDAGPADGGDDAAMDAGMDAGDDAGFDAGMDAGDDAGPPPTGDLIISEYVEGSGFYKAIELYNGTGGALDLSSCTLTLRSSCGGGSSTMHNLSGSLAAGATWVLCHPSIPMNGACDETPPSNVINHNGDDMYELACDGSLLDVFGSTMGSCGPWTGGDLSSRDRTLRRMAGVTSGDTNGDDAFDPSVEWEGAPADDVSGLGSR